MPELFYRECKNCGISVGPTATSICPICGGDFVDYYEEDKKEMCSPQQTLNNYDIVNSIKELNNTLKSIEKSLSAISSCVEKDSFKDGRAIPMLRIDNWGH